MVASHSGFFDHHFLVDSLLGSTDDSRMGSSDDSRMGSSDDSLSKSIELLFRSFLMILLILHFLLCLLVWLFLYYPNYHIILVVFESILSTIRLIVLMRSLSPFLLRFFLFVCYLDI